IRTWAQGWPARTATPWRSRISETSCAWTPSIANETMPPRSSPAGGPKTVTPGTSAIRSSADGVGSTSAAGGAGLTEPAHTLPEPDRLTDRGRAAFELRWQIGPRDQPLGDFADHRAATD